MTGARFFAKQNERRRAAGLAEVRARAKADPGHRCDCCGKRVESLLEAVNWCDECNRTAAEDRRITSACACAGDGCDSCEGSL